MIRSPMRNEAEATKQFEELMGSPRRAERLLHLYSRSYSTGTALDVLRGQGKTKIQAFRLYAKREKFTEQEIDAFLSLQ